MNSLELQRYKDDLIIYQAFEKKCRELIAEILDESKIKYHTITSRVKDVKSLEIKIKDKKQEYIEKGIEKEIEITDLLGIRIITEYEDVVDEIADILKQEFSVDVDNCIDKRRKKEDEFGYLSLHLVLELNQARDDLPEYRRFKNLKFEVQIRSLLQHAWAVVSHDLKYKNDKSMPDNIHRKLNRQASILEEVDDNFKSIRKMTKDYKENVEEEVREEKLNEPINAISLTTYLNESTIVKETLLEMMKIINPNASEIYPANFIHNSIEKLNMLNIFNLQQLDELIKRESSKIPDLFDTWLDIVGKKEIYSSLDGLTIDTFIFYLVILEIIKNDEITEDIVVKFFEGLVPLESKGKKQTVENLKALKQIYTQ